MSSLKMHNLGKALAAGALTMGLLLGASTAGAQTVETDGNTATAIRGLSVGGDLYDVVFDNFTPAILYDDPPVFPFDNFEEAEAAVIAVNATLNAESGISRVGTSNTKNSQVFRIGYDIVGEGLTRLTVIAVGNYGDVSWQTVPQPDNFPFFSVASFADFTLLSGGATPTRTATEPIVPSTPTRTPTEATVPTATVPVPVPTATPGGPTCVGDCNGNGSVSLGEVQTGLDIFFDETLLDLCPAADGNDNGSVSLGEVQTALDNFFDDCPGDNPTPTPDNPTATVPVPTATAPVPTPTPDNPTPTPGGDFDEECSVELCANNPGLKANCIREIEDCIDRGEFDTEQCIAFGVETCTI